MQAYLRKRGKQMILFDGHAHTLHSPDSRQSTAELCDAAVAAGLHGVTVTDHVDIWYYRETDAKGRISASVADATAERGRHGDLAVSVGIELAEAPDDPALTQEIFALAPYDVVLGSVHCVKYPGIADAYSRVDFSDFSDGELSSFFGAYLKRLLLTAETVDYDCLAHLTCPLRYITGKYRRTVDLAPHEAMIREILRTVICRGKSLEVNTSWFQEEAPMPGAKILSLYRSLGGERISIGSDAHIPARVGGNFAEAERILRRLGFREYTVYRGRKPFALPFDSEKK